MFLVNTSRSAVAPHTRKGIDTENLLRNVLRSIELHLTPVRGLIPVGFCLHVHLAALHLTPVRGLIQVYLGKDLAGQRLHLTPVRGLILCGIPYILRGLPVAPHTRKGIDTDTSQMNTYS